VSVVTVNWNGRSHLEHLLPSLQGLGAGEILLVDNASEDDSVAFVLRRYPSVRVLRNPVNRGFAQPNNLAARAAKGRYLAFINNDMRADPKWLNNALAHVEGKVACVACRILDWEGEHIDFNGSSLQYLGYAVQRDIGAAAQEAAPAKRVLFACGGAMVVDRQVFLDCGGFDEDFFAVFEDVDFGWRLWLMGYEVAFAHDSVTFHRGHGTFQAHETEKMRYLMHRNSLLTVLKNYEEKAVRRVLPLAVALAVRRAVLFSGVEKEEFYLWGQSRTSLSTRDPAALARVLDALNHLVAVDDALDRLPGLLEKRRFVQSRRQRSDAEILPLFIEPLRTIVNDPEYLDFEGRCLNWLDLEAVFGQAPGASPAALADRIQQRTAGLRRQLDALRWVGGQALMHPPPRQYARNRLVRLWKRRGPRDLWRRLQERVDRGV
jgi:GT2 family glycosyltransferase